jgi:SNF2 family DNA or RNA helicase
MTSSQPTMRTRADLRPAQVALIEELKTSLELGAVLGMGGGKTVSALTAFLDLYQHGVPYGNRVDSMIVIAPPRVVNVWPREVQKWDYLQGLEVVTLTGSPAQRLGLARAGNCRVLVLSHDLIPWLVDNWPKIKPWLGRCVLTIDEISRLRNPRSKRAKKLLTIIEDFDAVWGLTGTPKPDGYEDLYMTLKVLTGGRVWGEEDFDTWRKMRFYMQDHNGYAWGIHTFAAEEVDRVADQFLMKVPDDHTSGIPALNEGHDFDIWADPLPEQQEAHKEMLTKLIVQITSEAEAEGRELTDEDYIVALSRGVASGKLEQIAQGFMYDDHREVALRFEDKHGNTLKATLLADALEEAGEHCLITYRFRQDLEEIERVLGPLPYLGGGVSQKEGQKNIDRWNEGRIKYLALHPLSAGHGIELQFGGRRMFNYNPMWSGEEYAQIIKRIHRPGQEKPVYIHNIGVRNLIDGLKLARCRGRVDEQIAFINKLRSMV